MHSMLPDTYLQATALAADAGNARLAARLSELWRAFTTINDFYLGLKGVCGGGWGVGGWRDGCVCEGFSHCQHPPGAGRGTITAMHAL